MCLRCRPILNLKMKSNCTSQNLLIEGWRGINHSYAMINQYQIRELLKNNKFKIYFFENYSMMTQE